MPQRGRCGRFKPAAAFYGLSGSADAERCDSAEGRGAGDSPARAVRLRGEDEKCAFISEMRLYFNPRGKRIIKTAVPSRDGAAARRIQETLYVAAAISLATPSITATALSVYEPE